MNRSYPIIKCTHIYINVFVMKYSAVAILITCNKISSVAFPPIHGRDGHLCR